LIMGTSNWSLLKVTLLVITLVYGNDSVLGQTHTIASGNWSTASNWSSGVPSSGTNFIVKNTMTIDANISAGGTDTISKAVTDLTGSTAFTLTVGGSLDMSAQGTSTFEGALNVNNGGILTIETGDTLIVGPNSDFANNSTVNIKVGGVLVVTGDLKNDNNSTGINVDGSIIVLGNFKGWNGSAISGTGSIQTTGSLTFQGSGQAFNNSTTCSSGPCSTNEFCTTNTVASSQSICKGATPAGLTANALTGYTYQWQQSTTSSYSGFTNVASGGTGQNYSPGAVSATTYYRRYVTNGTCKVYSVPVTVTANPTSVSVSISSNVGTTICSGTSVTFTATPGGGDPSPSYQWKVSGTNSGTNSTTFTTTTLTNGQTVTCVMTPSTGCASAATSNALVMSVNGTNSWVGSTSSAWSTGGNWCGGSVPTSSTNVTIPAGATNMPVISSSVSVKNITINASATLVNASAGTLNIYGNYVNNGTYTDFGTTAFTGSSAQTISGVADSINNLTINNTSGGVTISATTYVKKYLTLTSGTLTTGGYLTVDIYFGAILGSGAGSISGNINVTRTIWKDNWHYISSPLSGRTVADWNTAVPLKTGVYANYYTYDETNTSTNKNVGWTAVSSTSTSLTSMKGYSLYFPRYTYKTVFNMTGSYTHSQTYSIALTNTSSGVATSDGWNLVGNPYPSEIDWDAASGWTKTGLDNAIYFWDQSNTRYASYVSGATPGTGVGTNGGTRYIPCMQGFYVKVTNPGSGTLGTTNSVRSSVQNRDDWRVSSSSSRVIRLKATTGTYSDETLVCLTDNASLSFDSQFDAYKLSNSGNTPNLSTKLSDINYSINSLPSNTTDQIIPVQLIAGVSGTYTINADLSGLGSYESVVLEDHLLSKTQDLTTNPNYTASLVAGDTTSRFYLHYTNENSATKTSSSSTSVQELAITAYQQTVSISFPDQNTTANIYVCDAVGNKVYVLENANTSSGKIQFTLPSVSSGIYVVKVQSDSLAKSQQVYISR
jgi:hypothetical protein